MTTPIENTAPRGAGALMDLAMSFQRAKLVLTGLELGLFRALAEEPAGEADLRDRLALHPRGTTHFLRALTELGLLELVGGRYRASPAARQYLVPGQEGYLGGFLHAADAVMYPAWGRLAEGLRTGEAQAATFSGSAMFEQLYADDDKRDDFVGMAESSSRPLIPALAETFDWSSVKTVLELGGCRGNTVAGLVRAHPHLSATVLDLPPLRPVFDEHMARLGTAGAVSFQEGDFFTGPLPEADVVMIGHCLVDWTDDQRKTVIRNAHSAVRPGGAFLIWDPVLVPGEESYLRNLLRSLNLQLMTPHGAGYRLEDCRKWLQDSGFADVSHRSLGHDVTIVVARKDN
ncbi:methyltransferase [Amycolatopsis rubida]|nr:methyltransferase [Amycolatopsis rubida]